MYVCIYVHVLMCALMYMTTYMYPCLYRSFQPPQKSEPKPVVAFIKDPMVKKVSPNSDSSASDSGRGHSSEEGDTLRRTQPLNREYDFSPTTFSKPSPLTM